MGARHCGVASDGPAVTGRLYMQVARQLLGQLTAWQYGVGDRLPPERELCAEFDDDQGSGKDVNVAKEPTTRMITLVARTSAPASIWTFRSNM
jgi:hypothetical protein